MQPTTTEWAGRPYLDVLGRRVEQLLAVLQCKARRWVNEYHPAPPQKQQKQKKNKNKQTLRLTWRLLLTMRSCLKTSSSLFLCIKKLLLLFLSGLARDQQQHQTASRQNPRSFMSLCQKVWGGRSPETFSYREIYWKCTPCCHSPFLYLSRRRQENHSQGDWKAAETGACD